MSTQRFTPEFKAEAVRQVIERGYSVAETAERLGVSTHSLYKWVKAVTPDKTEKQASELLEAKSEILRLRAQMRRLEEERDILKAARYFARNPSEIPLHERAPTSIRDHYAVSGLQVARAGFYQWLHKPVSDREKENGRLLGLIRDSMRPVEVCMAHGGCLLTCARLEKVAASTVSRHCLSGGGGRRVGRLVYSERNSRIRVMNQNGGA
jgi:transposase-like protein